MTFAKESLSMTHAPAIGLLSVLFVILMSRYHLTVRLFISVGVAVSYGAIEILLLLKLTFRKVISVEFAVNIMS